MNLDPPIKYVLYTDQNDKWRIQCVPAHLNTFENRSEAKSILYYKIIIICESMYILKVNT